jgi:hypothetical protein
MLDDKEDYQQQDVVKIKILVECVSTCVGSGAENDAHVGLWIPIAVSHQGTNSIVDNL